MPQRGVCVLYGAVLVLLAIVTNVQEADILAGAAIVRFDRYKVIDYTFPFLASLTGTLIRAPDQYIDNTFMIVTRPFARRVPSLMTVLVRTGGSG